MQRIAVILGLERLAAMFAGGMWLAVWPPIQAVSPPDTTEMHVGIGWWE